MKVHAPIEPLSIERGWQNCMMQCGRRIYLPDIPVVPRIVDCKDCLKALKKNALAVEGGGGE